MASDSISRNRLAARLDAAVRAHGEPLPAPVFVVDVDAFDDNAADLVKRAAGKPVRVASKSLRVPALIRRALSPKASTASSPTRSPRRCGWRSRTSATTS